MTADPMLVLLARPDRSLRAELAGHFTRIGVSVRFEIADSIDRLIGLPGWDLADAVVLDFGAAPAQLEPLRPALATRRGPLPVYLIGDLACEPEVALVRAGVHAVVPPNRLDRFPVHLHRDVLANRAERRLKATERRLDELIGDEFFRELTLGLSEILGVRFAVVSQIDTSTRDHATTIAAAVDGAIVEPIDYNLEGTPCAEVARGGSLFVGSEARARYPDALLIQNLDVASLFGVPLFGAGKEALGVLALMDDKPMERTGRLERVVSLYAARAGAELERRRAEGQRASLQARLVESQKMEALGTLAGGIAHDFNNILMGILGNAEMATDELETWHPASGHLAEILRAAHRARDVVQGILTFSRKQGPERCPIALGAAIDELVVLLRATLPATIDLVVEHAPHPSPPILADPNQVHQVLMNLITNAAHAIGNRPGRITIGEESVAVDRELAATHVELREGRYARVSVSDTGSGVDRETLARIFEPFFTTKAPGEGTGLGLAVVHGIVQEHDGTIVVTSTPNQGSTFHLYFPALDVAVTSESVDDQEIPRGNGQHILLVDDEAAIVRVGRRMLERFGYRVTACSTGRAALAALELSPSEYQLIISDLTMPELTGLDIAERAKGLNPAIPILLTSGHPDFPRDAGPTPTPVDDVLTKPFASSALARAVHRLIAIAEPSAPDRPT